MGKKITILKKVGSKHKICPSRNYI